MLHQVARSVDGSRLWDGGIEGRALWDRVVGVCGTPVALVLMPNHLHLIVDRDVRAALSHALSGFVRWRDHRRARPGPGIEPVPVGQFLVDRDKVRRMVRYVHLNPWRARLCSDPLAWAFSTHRDWCGLAAPTVRKCHPSPDRFHAYVSGDPTVAVTGTELPTLQVHVPGPEEVLDAVSAVTRTSRTALRTGGPARTLAIRAARTLCPSSSRRIAEVVGVSHVAVLKVQPANDRDVRLVARVIGDPRFGPLVG